MGTDYRAWGEEIRRLAGGVERLIALAEPAGVTAPRQQEWYALLRHKLLPQVEGEPWLVAAVVGGTNIGKSVVFNHLAGENASGVSPLAAGTKHPVCLVPVGCDDPALLGRLFGGFQLRPWRSAQDPLTAADEDLLFWRIGAATPPRLLVLDTPDIDSDVEVNWRRADVIRQAADVLIAVLTQQKYNDAAVKRFFRKAAEADKPVVVVFNQCDLDEDRAYWPEWLDTFVGQTGAAPELVYVVPYDRAAAAQLRLPFYPVGRDGRQQPLADRRLCDELARLHFDAIKIRTLRGALKRVIDAESGAGGYLGEVRHAAAQFAAAAQALRRADPCRVEWPVVPTPLLVDEIRAWWDSQRQPLTRSLHGFYRRAGQLVSRPLVALWDRVRGEVVDPIEAFQRREREAVLGAVGGLLDELERLAELGNEMLRPRLERLLGGDARARQIRDVLEAHAALPAVDDDYRRFLRGELDRWGAENPRAVSWLRSLDHALALARPAVTVTLALSGWIVAGGIVHEAAAQAASQVAANVATQAAGHTAATVAAEAAITGGIAGGGEVVVSLAGETAAQGAARLFRRLQDRYAQTRAMWLGDWLEKGVLGQLLAELDGCAELAGSATFEDVEQAVRRLREMS